MTAAHAAVTRRRRSRPRAGLRSRRLLVPGSALLWGTQFAFLNPAIGIILVSLYGACAAEVGVALAAYNVSGFVSTLVVPTRADRRGDYLRPLLWCGGFTIALAPPWPSRRPCRSRCWPSSRSAARRASRSG